MKQHYPLRIIAVLSLMIVVSPFVSGQKKILFVGTDDVVGATRTCDKQIVDSLLAWGYDTLYLPQAAYIAKGTGSGVHSGIDGIMFSESCGAANCTPYAWDNYPIPAITLEAGVFQVGDAFWNVFNAESSTGAGDGGGIIVHTGETADATDLQVKIKDNNHYITEVFEKDQIITWSNAASPVLIPYIHGLRVDADILAVPVAPFTAPATGAEVMSMVMVEDNFPKMKVFWFNNTHSMLNDNMGTNDFYTIIKRAAEYTFDNIPVGIQKTVAEDADLVAYPNPAFGDVTIRFHVFHPDHAQVALLDVSGKQIDILYDNNTGTGFQFVTVKADRYPEGVYFIRLQLGANATFTKVMLRDF